MAVRVSNHKLILIAMICCHFTNNWYNAMLSHRLFDHTCSMKHFLCASIASRGVIRMMSNRAGRQYNFFRSNTSIDWKNCCAIFFDSLGKCFPLFHFFLEHNSHKRGLKRKSLIIEIFDWALVFVSGCTTHEAMAQWQSVCLVIEGSVFESWESLAWTKASL